MFVCVYVNEIKRHSGSGRGQECSRCVVFFSLRVCVCVNKCGMTDVSIFKKNISFNGSYLLVICLCAHWNVTGGAVYGMGRRLRMRRFLDTCV